MSNPSRLTYALTAASANAIALSQTPGAAGNLTLAGASVVAGPTLFQGDPSKPVGGRGGGVLFTNYAQLDTARRVLITSAGADSARVFTVYGFDRDLHQMSETVTGVVSGTPVATVRDFFVVTKISVDAATAAAITVGTNTVGSTAWIQVQTAISSWALAAAAMLLSGAATFQIEHTYDDVNASNNPPPGVGNGFITEANSAVPPVAMVTGATQSSPVVNVPYEVQYGDQPIVAHRLTILTGTGTVAFWSVQAGLIS